MFIVLRLSIVLLYDQHKYTHTVTVT